MITGILSALAFALVIYFFTRSMINMRKMKSGGSHLFEMKIGDVCYGCKDEIDEVIGKRGPNQWTIPLDDSYRLCQKCKREEALSEFILDGILNPKWGNRLKLFLLEDRTYRKVMIGWIAMMAVIWPVSIILNIPVVINLSNALFLGLMYYKTKIVKKNRDV